VHALDHVQAAMQRAMERVPLVHGACVGADRDAPDEVALQQLLARGIAVLDDLDTAVEVLLGPDRPPTPAGGGGKRTLGDESMGERGRGGVLHAAGAQGASVLGTSSLARQLVGTARQEVELLSEVADLMGRLDEAQVYANSMRVQLLQWQRTMQRAVL